MSESAGFTVTLHHLARDAKQAGVSWPTLELTGVTPEQLRALLEALAQLAPTVAYPVAPELRIASPEGQFLVQVREGHVRFTSWSLRAGGSELTPRQILAAITGEDDETVGEGGEGGSGGGRRPRWWKVAGLAVAILGSNGVTAWVLTRPPPDLLLPEHQRLDAEPAQRLLAEVAGDYATGDEEGDRTLRIARDGAVQWNLLGGSGTIAEETRLTATGAQAAGRPALLTSSRALIEVKDSITVVFYGDTYRRKAR